jgi:D-alanyl-D-alanine carboxypeptidase
VSAAVQRSDGTTWSGVSGRADLGPPSVAVTPDTPFVIASVTKTFVAATVLQLDEEGVLDIDAPLSRWLPAYPGGDTVRLRHLLAHTSGIADILDGRFYERVVLEKPRHAWTWPELRAVMHGPRWTPGRYYDYSNTNYILLGRVVELATGDSIAAQIRQRFLDPLGLTHTWFQGQEPAPATVARGYRRASGDWRAIGGGTGLQPTTSIATFVWAAGAMVSTPRDLVTWARALFGGRVLKRASMERMLSFGPGDYGLGVRRTWMGDRRAWGHGGALHGFETSLWYLPRLDAAVAVTWNRWPLESDGLADRIAEGLVDASDADVTPAELSAPTLRLALGATVRRGRVPAVVRWRAHDATTWVDRVEVRRRLGAGDWQRIATLSGSARAIRLDLRSDRRVVIAVRAIDHAGNATAWLRTPAVVPRIVGDGAAAIALEGTWRTRALAGALDGTVASSRTPASRATLDLPALAVGVVARLGPAQGAIRVAFGSGSGHAEELWSRVPRPRRLVDVTGWAQEAPRRVVVTVLDRPMRPRIDLDAFVVLEAAD